MKQFSEDLDFKTAFQELEFFVQTWMFLKYFL